MHIILKAGLIVRPAASCLSRTVAMASVSLQVVSATNAWCDYQRVGQQSCVNVDSLFIELPSGNVCSICLCLLRQQTQLCPPRLIFLSGSCINAALYPALCTGDTS